MAIETVTVEVEEGITVDVAVDRIDGKEYQLPKVMLGADGNATALWAGRAVGTDGVAYVDPRSLRVRLTDAGQTIAASSHIAKDAIGAIWTFANAVRVSGGSCVLEQVQVHDLTQSMPDLDIIFFDRTIAGTVTDDAAFDPTDADLDNVVAVVTIGGGQWADFNDNSVADIDVNKSMVLNGTSLFAAVVARSTTTTAASSIQVTVTIKQD